MSGDMREQAHIDWTAPPGRPDWLFGTGAVRSERLLVWLVALTGCGAAVLAAYVGGAQWAWWQWLLVVAVTVDVVGGVPANALGSAKRLYHGPAPVQATPVQRLLHHDVGFTAAHVHPFVLAAVLPGGTWLWAAAWYATCLAGVLVVRALPLYLRRPAAFGVVALVVMVASVSESPDGLAWFGAVLVVKLVAAHAVREEPYRPGTSRADRS